MSLTDEEVEKRLEEQQQREKLAREQRAADWKTLLDSPAGRRSLELVIFEFGGLQAQAHSQSKLQRAFNDGQRQVAIELDRELKAVSKDGWARMHTERIERQRLEPNPARETDQ